MSPIVLQNSHAVHRSKEHRPEHRPMIERCLEHKGREQAHGAAAGDELDERLHPASLQHSDGIR